MAKANKKQDDHDDNNGKPALRAARIELLKLQRHVIQSEQKVLVILEGRDAAGKDGTVKRIAQHFSPRETRNVALGVPSDRDRRSWYFQRYIAHLPVGGEIVLFNRSWYNRAGVERVMGFCSASEYEMFLKTVPIFEDLLVHCAVTLIKYFLDISRAEQKRPLQQRHDDPLSQWKLSRIDEKALKHWDHYAEARDEMLARTHSVFAPWTIVRADDKPRARLNLIRDLLTRFEFDGKNREVDLPDPRCGLRVQRGRPQKRPVGALMPGALPGTRRPGRARCRGALLCAEVMGETGSPHRSNERKSSDGAAAQPGIARPAGRCGMGISLKAARFVTGQP